MERYSSETNKLLIRLDKLLNNLPSDPIERKGKKNKKQRRDHFYIIKIMVKTNNYTFQCTNKQ